MKDITDKIKNKLSAQKSRFQYPQPAISELLQTFKQDLINIDAMVEQNYYSFIGDVFRNPVKLTFTRQQSYTFEQQLQNQIQAVSIQLTTLLNNISNKLKTETDDTKSQITQLYVLSKNSLQIQFITGFCHLLYFKINEMQQKLSEMRSERKKYCGEQIEEVYFLYFRKDDKENKKQELDVQALDFETKAADQQTKKRSKEQTEQNLKTNMENTKVKSKKRVAFEENSNNENIPNGENADDQKQTQQISQEKQELNNNLEQKSQQNEKIKPKTKKRVAFADDDDNNCDNDAKNDTGQNNIASVSSHDQNNLQPNIKVDRDQKKLIRNELQLLQSQKVNNTKLINDNEASDHENEQMKNKTNDLEDDYWNQQQTQLIQTDFQEIQTVQRTFKTALEIQAMQQLQAEQIQQQTEIINRIRDLAGNTQTNMEKAVKLVAKAKKNLQGSTKTAIVLLILSILGIIFMDQCR